MINPVIERIQKGSVLCDGAMGTALYSHGIPYQRCFDELCLSEPDLVQRIHREYIQAGAEIVQTNTYGANRYKLAQYGLEDKVRDINFRAVKIAREAREESGLPVFLAGSVGPVGQDLGPVGQVTLRDARTAFREQIDALLEAGADLLILETFSALNELREAILAAQQASTLPIIAEMTFTDDCRTLNGESPPEVVRALADLGVAAVGVNCGVGPHLALDVIQQMDAAEHVKLVVQPNAGFPARRDGRFFYFSTPEYFGDYATRFVEAGVSVIGGCCGTTPAHIAAMRTSMGSAAPRQTAKPLKPMIITPADFSWEEEEAEAPTNWSRKLARGEFVVSVELDPPKGLNPTKILEGAALLRDVGVDCINIGDSPMARVRMSCIALALLIQSRVGLETIIHFTTRDRNLMALQSELLGAHALGIRHILALTGDPPRMGQYPNATGVWDVDSIGLVKVLKQLNQGVDWAGNSIGQPSTFQIACAVNPIAEDLELELDRFHQKIEAGANFAMSQPLYDMDQLMDFLNRVGRIPIPFILGVMPLQSHKHTEFLHNELPGVTIPDAVRERMRLAGERGIQEGILQAQEFLSAAQHHADGVYFMPSFGRYEMVAELVSVLAREPAGGGISS
jgi:methionine synthase / methylenetetrahydrofolate reductase(NADPH)